MINSDELRKAVRSMTPRQALYRLLKEELTARGNWKALPRGKPDIYNLSGKKQSIEDGTV
jgi:hypothetical protein